MDGKAFCLRCRAQCEGSRVFAFGGTQKHVGTVDEVGNIRVLCQALFVTAVIDRRRSALVA
ncbi:hypothetical protein C0Z20_06100 [Trinickia symbiotica]|uniref:Uncharacterized protein n=1 Tax=Trinickia symbiotica TaxID=863227 RepID=A0A2N7X7I4_9BURK|nr:hypothetical protein C0Z20_06100 [Trinickia symbiotica]